MILRNAGFLASAVMLLAATASFASATGVTHVLNSGRYKIEVIVEDPTSGQQQTLRHVDRCLGSDAIASHAVFEMLSDTPASACPKYEVCAGQSRTGFIARCEVAPSTSAVGMFALDANAFRGRIEVKNGEGKLTNVEIQYGERVGDCGADELKTSQ